MQAIITKYYPATNMRGSRIKASCDRGTLWLSYPHELSGDDVHRAAVDALTDRFAKEDLKQYGTPIAENPWKLPYVTGGIPGGACVHVYLDKAQCAKHHKAMECVQAVVDWAKAPVDHGGTNPYCKPFVRLAVEVVEG